jgi:hypothetical protein
MTMPGLTMPGMTMPVISGLEEEGLDIGASFPSIYKSIFEKLNELNKAAPELYAAISEIEIHNKDYAGYDITLYPLRSQVRIRMSNNFDVETVRSMFLLVDVAKEKDHDVRVIDFRTGTASFLRQS